MLTKQEILNGIIKEIEIGTIPWQQPSFYYQRQNGLSGHVYQGVNRFLLYNNPDFLFFTFLQAKELGGKIKTESKAQKIVFWSIIEKMNEDGKEIKIPLLKTFNVFGMSQIDFPADVIDKINAKNNIQNNEISKNMDIEDFIQATKANILECETIPCYSPNEDNIKLPPLKSFLSEKSYYQTLFHEIGHWTGHEKRLKRIKSTKFASTDYNKEELTAELISCFLSNEYNMLNIENSAAYLNAWIKNLNENSNILFSASTQAEKGIKYLKELALNF